MSDKKLKHFFLEHPKPPTQQTKSNKQTMSMTKFCGFCASTGCAGPHDHTLRATKDPKSAVTCPRLRETQCGACGCMGHTAGYCGELKDKERVARQTANAKRRDEFNQGAWATTKVKAQPLKVQEQKAAAAHRSNPFAALNDSEEAKDERAAAAAVVAAEEHKMAWPAVGNPLKAAGADGDVWASVVRGRDRETHDEEDSMAGMIPASAIVFGKTRWPKFSSDDE